MITLFALFVFVGEQLPCDVNRRLLDVSGFLDLESGLDMGFEEDGVFSSSQLCNMLDVMSPRPNVSVNVSENDVSNVSSIVRENIEAVALSDVPSMSFVTSNVSSTVFATSTVTSTFIA